MESAPVLKLHRGFSLVEMLVVLAIISVITMVLVLSQSKFNRSIILTDTAYGVALSARQAQAFGLSSRKFATIQNTGFGLRFDMTTPTKYVLFADTNRSVTTITSTCFLGTQGRPDAKPGDCYYNAGQDSIATTYILNRGMKIKNICETLSNGFHYCNTGGDPGTLPLTSLDIVFTRPNTSTTISGSLSGIGYFPFSASCAEITLSDAANQNTQKVRVTNLGEISVGRSCP